MRCVSSRVHLWRWRDICKIMKLFLFLLIKIFALQSTIISTSSNVEVFLDHGERYHHAEVFYSVANMIKNMYPLYNITFVIYRNYGYQLELNKLYDKYAKSGPIQPFYYRFDEMPWYKPLAGFLKKKNSMSLICNSDKNQKKYWLRVVVTMPKLPGLAKCLAPYANSSKYLFLIHHPTPLSGQGGADGELITWDNAYVASNATTILPLTSRHFSPILMPVPPVPPNCHGPPIFISQGRIGVRTTEEIKWMLETPYNFTIKLMGHTLRRSTNDTRVKYIENSTFVAFHEEFLGAAFLLPLISPTDERTQSYFHGRGSSNLAFGIHFRLRLLSHIAVESAFHNELRSWNHYWYSDRKSFDIALRSALNDYSVWCHSTRSTAWA